jgi:hypothetical protein
MGRMTPADRLDLKEAIEREPELPMRVIEALDRESEALGISAKRRLHLRTLGTQVAFRMRQQSPSAVIEEYVGKVERMAAFHGGKDAWNRALASAAVNQSLWQNNGVALVQGQPGSALGSPLAVAAGAAVAATSAPAPAAAPDAAGPMARTVVTKSGPIYHGVVVQLDTGNHVTLRLATGEERRIPWSNVQALSAPRLPGASEPRSFSPARTVVMKDFSIFRGDLVESLPGEFITLQLADKTTRRIAWKDALRILNLELDNTPWARATVEPMNVAVKANGREYRGNFFELFPGQYLALRSPDGEFRIVATADIQAATALAAQTDDLAERAEAARHAKLQKSNKVLLAGGICLGLGIVITGTFTYLTISAGILFSIGITVGALLLIAGLVCLIVGAAIRPSRKP